jgi:hypothetical protein
MRAYASHEHSRQRMSNSFRERGRLNLDDLLRYLEDVSSEPAGEEAYRLALSLRVIGISSENLVYLLYELRDRLATLARPDIAHPLVRERIDIAARFLDSKRQRQTPSPQSKGSDTTKENVVVATAQPPAQVQITPDDIEIKAASTNGYEIARSIRSLHRIILFHNIAGLALYWTCFKPSTDRAVDNPSSWMEEDVIRIFP